MEYKSVSAKIIADSVSPQGVRLTTFELEYPRYIHAEIMTHRVFSRNAQSSRAVPVKKALEIENIEPIVWGKNKAGMSSSEELEGVELSSAKALWKEAVALSRTFADRLAGVGLHKQWAGRLTEWCSPIKVIVTATEWDNFFWLRIDHEAAQPEIVDLAQKMKAEMDKSNPQILQPGEWHLPYVKTYRVGDDLMYTEDCLEFSTPNYLSLELAKKVSAGCCAAVSYRNNPSVEKCLEIWDKLFSGPKPHLSPVEHQATPMREPDGFKPRINEPGEPKSWDEGITHADREGNLWSGNLLGWIQQRQLMKI